MSFFWNSFVFNGTPSEHFGVELYDIDGKENGGAQFPSYEIVSDSSARGYRPLHYGTRSKENLSFNLVFGVPDSTDYSDAYDISVIAAWLLGHSEHKWLELCHNDMGWIRFHCLILGIEKIDVRGNTIAYSCKVECDSPFAYTYPIVQTVEVKGATRFNLQNISSRNGYFYPHIRFTPSQETTSLSIKNKSDNDSVFELSNIPKDAVLFISGDTKCIACSNGSNLYSDFNGDFLRLARGDNMLEITGDGTVEFSCEFPINIGG